ncbi:MAG: AI-2E family transporter [bacterium]
MDDVKSKLHIVAISTSLLAAVAVGFALHWLQPVMIPLVLAILLMYGLAPLVDWIMARGRVGKGVAIVVALLFSVLGLLAVAELVELSVRSLAENKGVYAARAQELSGRLAGWLERFGLQADAATMGESLRSLPVSKWASSLANGLLGLVSNGFLVLIFLIYLLVGRTPAPSTGGASWPRSSGG